LLVAGAALGIGLAVASLLDLGGAAAELPASDVARVNGVPIRSADYLRAVAALASDRRGELSDEDKRHILDRLIDEELLVQYGVDLGLMRSDRRVRGDLVTTVLAAQVASVEGLEPSPQEVERFYAANRDFFATPGRLRVGAIWFGDGAAKDRAAALRRAGEAVAALRGGESLAAVRERLGDPQVAPIPDALLPPAKVREYAGPSVARALRDLSVGEVGDPIEVGGGVYVVVLREAEPGGAPPLAEIEPQVRAEMQRRAGDDAVRDTLERLRADADVRVRDKLP
jgi:parvulin-like peptidyl-prolyl isomerase